jgi:hypothetical protein
LGDAAHLGEPLSQVGQVPQQERRGHAGERFVREGEPERVSGDQPHAACRIFPSELLAADPEHPVGEIEADDATDRGLRQEGQRQIARARGDVQGETAWLGFRDPCGRSAPGLMAAPGHEAVHEVVAPRDAGEHLLDVARLVGPRGQVLHSHTVLDCKT